MAEYKELVSKLQNIQQLYGPEFPLCKSPEAQNINQNNQENKGIGSNNHQEYNVSNAQKKEQPQSPSMPVFNSPFKGLLDRCVSNPLLRQMSNLSIASEGGGAHFVPFGRGHDDKMMNGTITPKPSKTMTTTTATATTATATTESPLTPSPINNAITFDSKTSLRAISKPYFPHLHQSERTLQSTASVNMNHMNLSQSIYPSTVNMNVPPSASMIPSMPNLASSTMLQSIPNGSMFQSVPNTSSMLQSVPNSVNSYQIQSSVHAQQNIMIPQLIQIQPALYGMQPNLYGIYNIIQPNDHQKQQYQAPPMSKQESNTNNHNNNHNENGKNEVQCPPVSMLSVAGVRYHGQLYTVDVDEQSIALKNVNCMGTEGRKIGNRAMSPSDKIYEYVVFNATDISQLWLDKSPNYQNKKKIYVEGVYFGWPTG